jgi:hypothetical protein
MRCCFVVAALAVACATASIVSGRGPQHSGPWLRDDTLPNRSAANYLFNSFLFNVMNNDFDAASALLSDNATLLVSSVSCAMLNRTEGMAALAGAVSTTSVVGLQSGYHIVSERQGAFVVYTISIDVANNASAFDAATIFMVRTTPDHTLLESVYSFTRNPVESEVDHARVAAMQQFVTADEAGNLTVIGTLFDENATMVSYPEGQSYPAEVYDKAQILEALGRGTSLQVHNKYRLDQLYASCGYVVAEVSQAAAYAYPSKTSPAAYQSTAVRMLVALTFRGNTSQILSWTRFYWNQINVRRI